MKLKMHEDQTHKETAVACVSYTKSIHMKQHNYFIKKLRKSIHLKSSRETSNTVIEEQRYREIELDFASSRNRNTEELRCCGKLKLCKP